MNPRKLSIRLLAGWFSIYAASGIVALLFETGLLEKGVVQDTRTIFILQTVGVLISLAMIPVALGGFKKLMDRIEDRPLEDRVRIYTVSSWLRIAAFLIVVVFGVALYYLINDDIGLYCAVIGAICSMFSIPTRNTVEYDLDWDDDESDE